MKSAFLATTFLGISAISATAATLSGSTGYALSNNGLDLTVIGDLAMTSERMSVRLGDRIDAISYRPVTGELYGYQAGRGQNDDAVFTIDTSTGALTNTGATPVDGAGVSNRKIGFDFNNQIDAARAVSVSDENVVFFPSDFPAAENAGTLRQFTDLFYAEGDANEGIDPQIFANAYTNAVDGMTASETLQYALDARTDSLVTLANNAGTLSTVAPLTLDGERLRFNNNGGFEILSDFEGDNLALALLGGGGGDSTLYTIDLTSGIATIAGDPGNGAFRSFAAQTGDVAPVPLPAGIPLILTGLGALGIARATRRKTA